MPANEKVEVGWTEEWVVTSIRETCRFVLLVANLFECIASECKLQFVADEKRNGSNPVTQRRRAFLCAVYSVH